MTILMRLVGIDENGLGPLLGPLIVTCVSFEVSSKLSPQKMMECGRAIGIDDSKQSAGFGRMTLAESIALAATEKIHGKVPTDLDTLSGKLSVASLRERKSLCPKATLHPEANQSWRPCWEPKVCLPAFGGDPHHGAKAIAKLQRKGILLKDIRFAIACVGSLNQRLSRGVNKLQHNLSLFERLLLDARKRANAPLEAVCGQVGGIRKYPSYFRSLGERKIKTVEETRMRCRYEVEKLGDVSFEVKADATHLPVAFASMIGKYLRELMMERQMQFYQDQEPKLPSVSGYHDPVTRRFVSQSKNLRKKLNIQDSCFARLR